MALSRHTHWRRIYFDLIKDGFLPNDLACVTADGRNFSRAAIIDLISSGRDSWNEFKATFPRIQWYRDMKWLPGFIFQLAQTDLRRQDLSGYDLSGCSFYKCNFCRVKFNGANLGGTGPHGSLEKDTEFIECNLRSSKFVGSDLRGGIFKGSDLSHCELNGVSLSGADLSNVKLYKSLIAAKFSNTELSGADFENSYIFGSEFIDINLGNAINLSKANVLSHTVLDHRTLFKSGVLPEIFYRSCGLPDILVEYIPSLIGASVILQSVFISHSSRDEVFTKRVFKDLQEARVSCFYAPKDLKVGSLIRDAIDQAVHTHDRILIILSKDSIASQWVEHEVEAAFERERAENRAILFPIMLDDAVMNSTKGWASNLRRQRHIGDFRRWKEGNEYFVAFQKLLSDLK